MTELWQISARELALAVRERQASSREVVDAHLDRIDAVNGRVNAIVEVLAEPARAAADAADRAVAAGDALGAGVAGGSVPRGGRSARGGGRAGDAHRPALNVARLRQLATSAGSRVA